MTDSGKTLNHWATYANTHQDDDDECETMQQQESMTPQEVGITTHYYWGSDFWTTGTHNDCSYVQKLNLLSNPRFKPVMLVIEPNSLANINLLGHYDSLKHKPAQRTRHGMGHFRNYVYFSKHCTSSLKMLINPESTLIDPNRVFQFESRYFQYSLLQNKITFIHTRQEYDQQHQKRYQRKNNNNNNHYFKNDFNKNVSNNNNNNNNNNKNDCTITEYLVFRFWHSTKDNSPIFGIAKRTDNNNCGGHIYQPWQCIDIVEHCEMLEYFNLTNSKVSSQNEFLSLLPTPVECYNKPFNNSISCEFNPNFHKIGGILRRGYDRYREGLMWDSFNEKQYHNNHNHNNNNNRMVRKNEPKFEYLDGIAMEMGITFDELVDVILNAITKAYKFARENPSHVLTQAYIDEQNCQIFYESVLLAELTDYNTMKTYTLGVPVVDILNEENASMAPCYMAESILTPQMTIENIMLNTQAENFNKMKQDSWISRMLNGKSFYYMCGFEKEIADKEKEKAQIKAAKAVKSVKSNNNNKVHEPKSSKTKGWHTDFPWNSTKYYYYK